MLVVDRLGEDLGLAKAVGGAWNSPDVPFARLGLARPGSFGDEIEPLAVMGDEGLELGELTREGGEFRIRPPFGSFGPGQDGAALALEDRVEELLPIGAPGGVALGQGGGEEEFRGGSWGLLTEIGAQGRDLDFSDLLITLAGTTDNGQHTDQNQNNDAHELTSVWKGYANTAARVLRLQRLPAGGTPDKPRAGACSCNG